MRTETTSGLQDVGQVVVPSAEVEPPLYRSRFGGLWTDRRDAQSILEKRVASGEVTDTDAKQLAKYIDDGYVVFENATDKSVIDEYLALFEDAWNDPPDRCWLQWKQQCLPMNRRFYDEVAKVGSLHLFFSRAGELIFPEPVLRFLSQIYDRPPVAFSTLTMRKGSEETLHIDTGPLTLTEPMSLAGCWLALEDVRPLSGEFQFIPGSHRLPELLHYGIRKGHNGDHPEYHRILQTTLQMCDERGLKTETFMANKGDVLIWHGDLMHGGAPIQDPSRTRLSLIAHVMPLGVMPTFFDFSKAGVIPYLGGGYSIDVHWSEMISAPETKETKEARKDRLLGLWRDTVPLSIRKRVPSPLTAWARKHVPI